MSARREPAPLERGTLYANQIEAVTNLKRSLKHNRPRALVQMATGSGRRAVRHF